MFHPTLQCFLAVCEGCGTARSVFPEGRGESFYDEGYYDYDVSRPRWKQLLKRALWRMPGASKWFPIIPPSKPGRVLEIGCGYGQYLNQLKPLGWETYGTEIYPKAVEFARKQHNICLASEANFPEHFFDWITLDNVLEHISDPTLLLLDIRHWLRPDGVLTVCVPHFGGIDSKFWGPHWWALMPPHHEYHYTGEGLRRLLADAGFDCELTYQLGFDEKRSAEYRGSDQGVLWLKLRKVARLLFAPKISSEYGYFVTAIARLSTPSDPTATPYLEIERR